MFIEPRIAHDKKGWIEVICGSMFSGKTEELIRRLRRAKFANLKVEIFKPMVDTRYDEVKIVSHNDNAIMSTPLSSATNMLILAQGMDVVGIDEAQFFDDSLPEVCEQLANMGIRVIIAGLDMDYRGKPFGPMPHLLATADYITKVHAICMRCGDIASFSYRLVEYTDTVLLGEKESYEPRCRSCFFKESEA
jgi:thymidine kinase